MIAPAVPNLTPRVFGCVAFVHLHKHQRDKLSPRALRCVFLGYATHQKGYRCFYPPTQRMFVTVDVVFHEESMYFSNETKLQGEDLKNILSLNYEKVILSAPSNQVVDESNLCGDEHQEMGHDQDMVESDLGNTAENQEIDMVEPDLGTAGTAENQENG